MIKLHEVSEFSFPEASAPADLYRAEREYEKVEIVPARTIGFEDNVPPSARRNATRAEFPVDLDFARVKQRAVHLFKSTNVYCTPIYGVVIKPDGGVLQESYEGARWVTPTKALIPGVTVREDGAYFQVPDDVRTIEKGFVFVNFGGATNYGHFVLDCLTSLVICEKFLADGNIPIIVPQLKEWQRRHVELLKTSVPLIEVAEQIVYVKELYHTDAMNYFLRAPNASVSNIALRQLEALPNSQGINKRDSRIFLARADRTNRLFPQENTLIGLLRPLGIRPVRPEQMSIDDQIAIFHDADVVIGPFGAAFTNVMYCRPGTLVIVLMPHAVRTDMFVRNICAIRGCVWAAIDIPSVEPNTPLVIEGQTHSTLGLSYDPEYDITEVVERVRLLLTKDADLSSVINSSWLNKNIGFLSRIEEKIRRRLTHIIGQSSR